MTSAQHPRQYVLLFQFLRECSTAYADRLGKLETNNGGTWNPRTAQFEVDTYLTFRLSASLLHLEHSREVWADMCHLCQVALTAIHAAHVASKNLADVIVARIQDYGQIGNAASQSGDAPQIAFIDALRQHIRASSHEDRVEAEHPMIIGDIFGEHTMRFEYLRVELFTAGAFVCGLKHVCQHTSDLRLISEEKLRSLMQAGLKESVALAVQTLDAMTRKSGAQPKPNVEPKRWWQFWR